jgi:hypothetical protein
MAVMAGPHAMRVTMLAEPTIRTLFFNLLMGSFPAWPDCLTGDVVLIA